MIYLDTSAMVKLLVVEAESSELLAWLATDERADLVVTSDLARVELMRAALRLDDPGLLGDARTLLGGIDSLAISAAVIEQAQTIGTPALRSLDAIHLASAAQLKAELSTFVTYDKRLGEAAAALGMVVATPGANDVAGQ